MQENDNTIRSKKKIRKACLYNPTQTHWWSNAPASRFRLGEHINQHRVSSKRNLEMPVGAVCLGRFSGRKKKKQPTGSSVPEKPREGREKLTVKGSPWNKLSEVAAAPCCPILNAGFISLE